jgi:hypothetical protein
LLRKKKQREVGGVVGEKDKERQSLGGLRDKNGKNFEDDVAPIK